MKQCQGILETLTLITITTLLFLVMIKTTFSLGLQGKSGLLYGGFGLILLFLAIPLGSSLPEHLPSSLSTFAHTRDALGSS